MIKATVSNITKIWEWIKKHNNVILMTFMYASMTVGYGVAYLLGGMYNNGSVEAASKAALDTQKMYQQNAIEMNYAQFDEKSGQWRWKTPQEAAVAICERFPKVAESTVVFNPPTPTTATELPFDPMPCEFPLPEKPEKKKK